MRILEEVMNQLIRAITNPILKFNETVISIVDETIPKTSTNHGLMMIAKMSSQIAIHRDRYGLSMRILEEVMNQLIRAITKLSNSDSKINS
jgi:CRISPR/Cas system CSM-associated protein Csm2 small subunit